MFGGAGWAPGQNADLSEPEAPLVLFVLRISAVVFEPLQARRKLPGRSGRAGPEADSPAGLCAARRSAPFCRSPGAWDCPLPLQALSPLQPRWEPQGVTGTGPAQVSPGVCCSEAGFFFGLTGGSSGAGGPPGAGAARGNAADKAAPPSARLSELPGRTGPLGAQRLRRVPCLCHGRGLFWWRGP